MPANGHSAEPNTTLRAGRFLLMQTLLRRDKTPVALLLLAALVGVLTGLVGVAFDKAVNFVVHTRLSWLEGAGDNLLVKIAGAFMLSALLGAVGYLLVRRFAPEAGGSGIPEIEGALEELRPVRW